MSTPEQTPPSPAVASDASAFPPVADVVIRHHVVMKSGGIGSWATGSLVVKDKMRPGDRLTLLFADTLMEDPDLYRFLAESSANIGGELVVISDGRDPWQVFAS